MESNICEIFNEFGILMYSINGNIFIKQEKRKFLHFLLFISFHLLWMWNYKLLFFSSTFSYKGTREIVRATCHVTEVVFTLSRLIWNWMTYSTFVRCLAQLISRVKVIQGQYFKTNNNNQGIWLLIVLVFILIELSTLDSSIDKYWVLPLFKDAFEVEFLIFMLNKIQESFILLNSQMTNYLSKIGDNDVIDGKDVHPIFSMIREVSMNHYRFVNVAIDMGTILSLSVIMILSKNFIDLLNSSYYPINSLINPNSKDDWNMGEIYWVLFSLTKSYVLLYKWNQLIQQANSTSRILHDIWNMYRNDEKFHGKENNLHLISTRFLASKLRFTALGFFPINFTYLHKLIYSAGVYIIILVQLQK